MYLLYFKFKMCVVLLSGAGSCCIPAANPQQGSLLLLQEAKLIPSIYKIKQNWAGRIKSI